MSNKPIKFTKYNQMGAYHWDECDKSSKNYNPPLEARYKVITSEIRKEKYVLDVGCGDGFLMSRIYSFCDLTVGIDNEISGLDKAKKKLKNYENCLLINASCYEVPFLNNHFNVAYMADVIEHLSDPQKCLNEISRVLLKEGKLYLTTPKWRPDKKWDLIHVKEYQPNELIDLLKYYFKNIEIKYFWPLHWSNLYATALGWHLIKYLSKYYYNPFLKMDKYNPEKYGQIFVNCSNL